MINLGILPLPVLYIVFTAGMFLLSIVVNGLLLKFSLNLGSKNESQVRWASVSKPAFGGISFFILFLLTVVFYAIFFEKEPMIEDAKFLGLFAATSMGFMMGLADDAYNTKPFIKFAVQFACAIVLIITGNVIQVFPYEWLNIFTTFFWVVGLMNSINMLDNMDGITTSVSIVISIAAAMLLLFTNDYQSLNMVILIGVISALSGFLYYNWNPSRMYMGDSGSQFLGVFLAGIGIQYFWNEPDYYGQLIPSKQLLIAILIFVVPISDTFTVSVNRIMKGKSPFVGGKDHTTHHLSYLGLTDRKVAIVMIAISLFTMVLSVFIMNNIRDWKIIHTLIFAAIFLAILSSLYATSRISKSKSTL
jgi:UDP-GlcNAc:undecaprenyl-phosphate GlcNAc-1-phosphate transferase